MKNIRRPAKSIFLSFLAAVFCLCGCHKGKNWALPEQGPPPVVPAGKFDLKGFYLGMSQEDARRVAPVFCADLKESASCYGDRQCWIDGMTLAGKKTKTTYLFFKDNELTALAVKFPTAEFEHIAAVLNNEYGKAGSTKTEKVRNGFGMPFEKLEISWKVRDAAVSVSNLYEKVTEGAVEVRPANPSAKFKACQLLASNKAKADL